MPEHTSLLTLLMSYMKDTLARNARMLGDTAFGHEHPTWRSWEPIFAALLAALLIILLSAAARGRLNDDDAVEPDEKLTLRTFFEAFLGYWYDFSKSLMDEKRAKKYFPLIGTSAIFVFLGNALALVPGAPVATSSLNVTLGAALVVFVLFNVYGMLENGWDYVAHLAGPKWYLAPLLFPIEVLSLFVRPVTLSIRLMLNMSVDHMVLAIFMGMVPLLVPVPLMILGCLVIVVQTAVFTILTTIYVALATEDMAHDHH